MVCWWNIALEARTLLCEPFFMNGNEFTTLKDRTKEIKAGLYNQMLKDLGLKQEIGQ